MAATNISEIGFIHFSASILASGLLDTRVVHCNNYDREKEIVKNLLNARYDVDTIAERSRQLIADLIRRQLDKWWLQSRYNVQIDLLRSEIMSCLADEVRKFGRIIVKTRGQSMFVDSLSNTEFEIITAAISARWPGLIMYYEPNADPNTTVPMH